jgi:hypothetical protein
MDPATYALIGAAYAEVEAKEPWCLGVTPLADVALLSQEAAGVQGSGEAQARAHRQGTRAPCGCCWKARSCSTLSTANRTGAATSDSFCRTRSDRRRTEQT